MVPVVLGVVVLTVSILHHGQTTLILVTGFKSRIIATKQIRGSHAGIDVGLVFDVAVSFENWLEGGLAEVASMVQHNVEDNLYTLSVCLIDERLERYILRRIPFFVAFVAQVYF